MMRFLAQLLLASTMLAQICVTTASTPSWTSLSGLQKRGNGGRTAEKHSSALDDYEDRLIIGVPLPASTLEQTGGITQMMKFGLGFYFMQVGRDGSKPLVEKDYVTGDLNDINTWPNAAYVQRNFCTEAANLTLFNAMQACGPKETCDSDFVLMTFWGTLTGMTFVKDGVMLYQCVAYQTVKSQCKSLGELPCTYKVLGEYHTTMWPDGTSPPVIFGNGAKSVAQATQEMQAYNEAHKTTFTLPGGGEEKSSTGKKGDTTKKTDTTKKSGTTKKSDKTKKTDTKSDAPKNQKKEGKHGKRSEPRRLKEDS